MKVGFIGLGKMGAGICSNIVKNGIDVVVYDINPANVQKFVDMGASSAATVKELAAQVGGKNDDGVLEVYHTSFVIRQASVVQYLK